MTIIIGIEHRVGAKNIWMEYADGGLHLTTINPTTNYQSQMTAVNSHLAGLGKEPIAQSEIDRCATECAFTQAEMDAYLASL